MPHGKTVPSVLRGVPGRSGFSPGKCGRKVHHACLCKRPSRGTASIPSLAARIDSEVRGWLPAAGVHLTEEQIAGAMDRATSALASCVQPDGRVLFETSAHIATVAIR
jgi:hypothetical protein